MAQTAHAGMGRGFVLSCPRCCCCLSIQSDPRHDRPISDCVIWLNSTIEKGRGIDQSDGLKKKEKRFSAPFGLGLATQSTTQTKKRKSHTRSSPVCFVLFCLSLVTRGENSSQPSAFVPPLGSLEPSTPPTPPPSKPQEKKGSNVGCRSTSIKACIHLSSVRERSSMTSPKPNPIPYFINPQHQEKIRGRRG